MIVFDLKCAANGHVFEAWFGSGEDYEGQRDRGLVACPLCGDSDIGKAVMAPAVPAKSNRMPSLSLPVGNAPDLAKLRATMRKLAAAQTEALKDSQWVGRDFADTARAMHYGEQDHASIHGEVGAREARALIEEGVKVAPLPFPVVPPAARN